MKNEYYLYRNGSGGFQEWCSLHKITDDGVYFYNNPTESPKKFKSGHTEPDHKVTGWVLYGRQNEIRKELADKKNKARRISEERAFEYVMAHP